MANLPWDLQDMRKGFVQHIPVHISPTALVQEKHQYQEDELEATNNQINWLLVIATTNCVSST